MKSDSWLFRFFKEFPGYFFRLMGQPVPSADTYHLEAIELKDVSLRIDGVFVPKLPGEHFLFMEGQFYKDDDFYLDWMVKILLCLRDRRPRSDWRGLVLFRSKKIDVPYRFGLQEWIHSGRVQVVYVDELPEDPVGFTESAVLKLTTAKNEELIERAKGLVDRARTNPVAPELRAKAFALIEAFVVSNLPKLTREEIQNMLQLHDISESVVFQEGLQEGRKEGFLEGEKEGVHKGVLDSAKRLLASGFDFETVVKLLALSHDLQEKLRVATKAAHGPTA